MDLRLRCRAGRAPVVTIAPAVTLLLGDCVEVMRSTHPTVKPTDLMRYLCRLVTPPGGLILDPFCGSGSTGKAALLEGFRFVGVERDAAYYEIAEARLARVQRA